MNWVIITTGLIFLICVIVGLYRGAVKIAVYLVATVVTFIPVSYTHLDVYKRQVYQQAYQAGGDQGESDRKRRACGRRSGVYR